MASGTPNKKNPSNGQSTGSPVPTKPPMVPSLFDEPAERVTGGEEFQARYQSIANVFREAAALPDRRARYSAIKSKLIPLLLQDKATQDDAFQALDDLIRHGLALKGSTPDESGDVTLFAELLTDDTLDEWVREKIAGIVRTREAWWGGDLHPVIEKLAKASNVAIDWMGWRICGKVLTTTEQVEGELIDTLATKWVIEHLFGNEKDPWTWRVYGHILSHSKENDYRTVAVQRLGAYGPTSTQEDPPDDVKEVRNLLERLFEQAEDPELQKAAKAALDLNRAGGVKAAGQTRTIISAPDWESWAALSSGCIVDLVEPPKLLIHPNLTIIPSPGETFHVPRMDSSQEASLGTTAAPSPDLDLSSHQFTRHVADPIVAQIGEICKTLRDIAADHPEAIPVILKGVRNLSADLGAGDALPSQGDAPDVCSAGDNLSDYLTTSQAAIEAGWSSATVRKYCGKKLPATKIGSREWLVRRDHWETFLKEYDQIRDPRGPQPRTKTN